MDYENLPKKKLIEMIREFSRREWEYLESPEKDYYEFLINDFSSKREELQIRNEQMNFIQGQLEESQEKYVKLYDNAPVGYLTLNDKGIILEINQTGSDLIGYSKTHLKGIPFSTFVHKDYTLTYFAFLNRYRNSSERVDTKIALKSGKYFHVIATPSDSRKKTVYRVIINDITEIKKAEENNRMLASIVELSEDAIYTRTFSGNITSWNPAAEKMYGYSESEIIGENVSLLYAPDLKNEYMRLNEILQKRGSLDQYKTKHITRDGRIMHVSASFSLLEKGDAAKVAVITRDISEQVEYEEKLSKSLQEKELLLKEIHHRVKNNLQIISSLLNLQRSHIKSEDVLESFTESQNRIRAMALVHEQLYLSGTNASINVKYYLTELIRFIFMSYPLQEKYIKFFPEIEDGLIYIDLAIDIGLIINELVTNSVKYAFNDKSEGEIKLSVKLNDHAVDIFFSDNGVGIPEDYLERQESLGLTIIRSLVEQNSGEIKIINNAGTEFHLILRQ